MTFHAVYTKPSQPSVMFMVTTVFVALLLAFFQPLTSRAATLGVITAIDRSANELAIDGQTYRVDSFSEVRQTGGSGAEDVAAWYSLNVGDYVVFDAQNGRIKSLRRETADSLDLPRGRPLELGTVAPAGR